MLNQFLSMFTFKKCKKVLQFVMRNDFPSFLTCIFYIFSVCTPGKQPYFEISEMTTHTPCARDIWWTLDFASAFLSPGVNSRTELVPSPRAYYPRPGISTFAPELVPSPRNGDPRRWLGNYYSDKNAIYFPLLVSIYFYRALKIRRAVRKDDVW
jgi:hypothetical protein